MKFNKGKCQILQVERDNHEYIYRLGNERLESRPAKRDLCVLVHGKLNMSQQCPGSQKGQPCPGGIRHSITSWAWEGIVPLYSQVGQPHLEYFVQFWVPQYKTTELLESIQRRATKVTKGPKKPSKDGLVSSVWRKGG
ncbi:hypothetical protein DUI87_09295 [Hirundo rustica rustica]|uniref:Uncharacterized protein n=1 Tax=Hirundo rustica rustica TaxID=333673 RepID=A0A3M0KS72_HIRRU|nr:hypothetical protein DUI87_09295 [Hirundo rustica rustica]